MMVVGAIMLQQLLTRQTLDLNVIRDRSPPFVRLADGSFRNDFALKVINMAPRTRHVAISVYGLEGAHIVVQGGALDQDGRVIAEARPDSVANVRLHVVAPAQTGAGSHPLRFEVQDLNSDEKTRSASAFLAGGSP
jgi:polyferredoxin